jgi:glutathione S-transferase
MRLYYMPGASSLASHIVLEWSGIRYQALRMNRHSIRDPQYLALNPIGTVPLLVHGDFVLAESVAILCYLADLHPDLKLLGDGTPTSRAKVMRWLGFLASDVQKAFGPIFYPERFLPGAQSAAALAASARIQVRGYLGHLDSRLEGRAWLTDDRSIADALHFVILRWAIGAKVGLQDFPNLTAFARRIHADQDVHAALVMEEGLAPRGAHTIDPRDQLERLRDKVSSGAAIALPAEVVGLVEYREGEGMPFEVRRGVVEVEIAGEDSVLSWSDENQHGRAAVPLQNLFQYVRAGAIRLDL